MITSVPPEVTGLIYELLDAHDDTAQLAAGLGDLSSLQPARHPASLDRAALESVQWEIHLEYLRALQRKGREILAQVAMEEAPQ